MAAPIHLLLVEDEARLAESLRQGLAEEGFSVEWAGSAEAAEAMLARTVYDLIVLDIKLPGKDGLTFLQEFRAKGNVTAVLILTARSAVEDRVSGLNTGADDYLVKPFAFAELLARVRALSRRGAGASGPALLKVGNLEFDTAKRRARRAGRAINLSPKETMLLELLMRNAGQVVTRNMIAEAVWDSNYNDFTNLIDVFVNRLRQKIDIAGSKSMIATVRGVGYSMRPE
ncbi:MAG TPA: response regulator transcription factor [Candidatus Binataceae bacterium]